MIREGLHNVFGIFKHRYAIESISRGEALTIVGWRCKDCNHYVENDTVPQGGRVGDIYQSKTMGWTMCG